MIIRSLETLKQKIVLLMINGIGLLIKKLTEKKLFKLTEKCLR